MKSFEFDDLFAMAGLGDASDTFRCMIVLLSNDKTAMLVKRRFAQLSLLGAGFSSAWHNYCTNAAERHFVKPNEELAEFPQAKIADRNEFEGWLINIPKLPKELRAIGRNYRHCIGGKHYKQRAYAGDLLFSIKPTKAVIEQLDMSPAEAKGFAVHADRTGHILQTQGFARRLQNSHERKVARNVVRYLIGQ